MGCGASIPDEKSHRPASAVSSPVKQTNVEVFDEATVETSEDPVETPVETSIDWEWTSSGTKRDRATEGDFQKFKEDEEHTQFGSQIVRTKSANARAAPERMEPIIELEDFEDGDFNATTKAKAAVCVEADEASSCATPRI